VQADRDRVERLKAVDQLSHETKELKNQVKELETGIEFLTNQGNLKQKRLGAFEELITILQNSSSYKLLTKLRRLSWFDQKARQLMASPPIPMTKEDLLALRSYKLRLAIDLTPVRPGGENGGAKIMALNMIRQWSETLAPDWEYILLTSEITHEELAWLDKTNVRRECVNFNAATPDPETQEKVSLRARVRDFYQQRVPVRWQLKFGTFSQNIKNAPQSGSMMERIGADLLYCPFTAPFYHDPTVPIVIVVYDLQYRYYPLFFTPEDIYHTERYFQQSVAVANRLICISEHTRKTVLDNSNINPALVKAIQTCLFKPFAKISEEQAAQVLNNRNLEKDGFLYYPANFWQHKNHQLLILAFSQYLQSNPHSELKLVLSGSPGPRMKFLEECVEKMGLQEKVIFLGYVSDEELISLYQTCRAVIFPSLFEGFGGPVLEAMSYGRPVLSSNVTSLPEVGGDAVLYFDPRKVETIVDAIQQIANNDNLVNELGQRGIKRSKEFGTPKTMAEAYLDVLCQVYAETRQS
jgi:glycosyltransferase involved in cell wall biosynthesis